MRPLLSEDGGLRVVTLDPGIEEELTRAFSAQAPAGTAGLEPSFVRRVLEGLKKLVGEQVRMATPVLFCSTPARFHLRRLLEPFLPKVVVLVAGRDSPGHPGAVVGNDPMRRKHECRLEAYEQMNCPAAAGSDQLLLEQLPQVKYIARRIHERLPQHVPFEDLLHAGIVGLIDAMHKYDASKNVRFASYAKFRIRGAILDSLRDMDWSPRDLRRKARRLESDHAKAANRVGTLGHGA